MPLGKLVELSSKVSPIGTYSQSNGNSMPLGEFVEPSSKASQIVYLKCLEKCQISTATGWLYMNILKNDWYI